MLAAVLDIDTTAQKITDQVVNPIILIIFAVGLLVFVFGIAEFLWALNGSNQTNTESLEKGKRHMIYGLIGMFIMVSAFELVRIIQGFFPTPPTRPF